MIDTHILYALIMMGGGNKPCLKLQSGRKGPSIPACRCEPDCNPPIDVECIKPGAHLKAGMKPYCVKSNGNTTALASNKSRLACPPGKLAQSRCRDRNRKDGYLVQPWVLSIDAVPGLAGKPAWRNVLLGLLSCGQVAKLHHQPVLDKPGVAATTLPRAAQQDGQLWPWP